jgi:hypothetical protein
LLVRVANSAVQNRGILAYTGTTDASGQLPTARGIAISGLGQETTGFSVGGFFTAQGSNSGTNYGAIFEASNVGSGNHFALKIIDGTQQNGYVLTCDADGNASWGAPSAAALTGSGTADRVTKWTATSQMADSIIRDDGARLGFGTAVASGQFITSTSGLAIGFKHTTTYAGTGSSMAGSFLNTGVRSSGANYGIKSEASGHTANNIGGFFKTGVAVTPISSLHDYAIQAYAASTAGRTAVGINSVTSGAGLKNVAGYFSSTGATTNLALETASGGVRFGGLTTTPAANHVLVSTDVNGNLDFKSITSIFSNTNGSGTTANGTAVDLGGALTANTTINGGGTHDLSIGGGGSSGMLNGLSFYAKTGYEIYATSASNNPKFTITTDETTRTSAAVSSGFVSTTNEHSGTTFTTTAVNGSIETISAQDKDLWKVTAQSNTKKTIIQAGNGMASMEAYLTSAGGLQMAFEMDSATNITTFTDSRTTTKGIEYGADYQGGYTTRSLVDKNYVDTRVIGNSGLATMAASTIKANITTAVAAPTDVALADVTSALASVGDFMLGFTATGAIRTFTASKLLNTMVQQATSESSISIDVDVMQIKAVSALGSAAGIPAPGGTPTNGQKLTIRIKDNGTARVLTWTTTAGGFRAVNGAVLPLATLGTVSDVLIVDCMYNLTDNLWDVYSVGQKDSYAFHSNVAGEIYSLTQKASLSLDDVFLLEDSTGGLYPKRSISYKDLVKQRIGTSNSSNSYGLSGDQLDQFNVTALAVDTGFTAPSGTIDDGHKLTIRIHDNGSAHNIAWTTTVGGFRAVGVTLPTTTVANKLLYVGCIYNATDDYWDVVAVNQEA